MNYDPGTDTITLRPNDHHDDWPDNERAQKALIRKTRRGAGSSSVNLDWLDLLRTVREKIESHTRMPLNSNVRHVWAWIDCVCPVGKEPVPVRLDYRYGPVMFGPGNGVGPTYQYCYVTIGRPEDSK